MVEPEWLESAVEAVSEADFKHLATAALTVPLLIASKVDGAPTWGRWRFFCQISQETETKLTYFRGLEALDPVSVGNLIKAGILIMTEPQKAGVVIREAANSEVDVDLLAAGVILVTIYSLVGINQYRNEVMRWFNVGHEEWYNRLNVIGIVPDKATVEKIRELFGNLPEYL